MEEKTKKISIPLVGILNVIIFLAFFFAKIFDKIDWNWWWVFSPLWIPFAILFGIGLIVAFIYFIATLIGLFATWKRLK